MKKYIVIPFLLWIMLNCASLVSAQEIFIHSHNDYRQRVPFFQAYSQQLSSIEADVFITAKDQLVVCHDREEVPWAPTFSDAYVKPLVSLFEINNGKAWRNSDKTIQLLIDLKTPVDSTLQKVISELEKYPEVFDPKVNPYAVRVVISGNRPDPSDFHTYSSIISFDGNHTNYTPRQLEKISLISFNLRNYTQWKGEGPVPTDELKKIEEVIETVHRLGKPIRFWGTPDGVPAWKMFHALGVDYINTDNPEACAAYFNSCGRIKLRFNDQGKFKIAQFTDLHWSHKSANCTKTIATIRSVLETEKPDIAMLTGDIVTNTPAKEAWLTIARIFEETETPFAVMMGNHDAEAGISKEEIFDLMEDLPYYVGEKGPDGVYGYGNFVLPVAGRDAGTSALLYCFDSNDYPPGNKYGHYDWIHYDQIDWYRNQSKKYTSDNNNIPLPALAFFHIPLPEYKNMTERNTIVGNKEEGVASPVINTGMFASMVEMKDVMGVFVGHDHNNDYIGMEYDIALAFGRVTGTDAYGKFERGARIIELHEDKFRFDTWIRTPKGIEFAYYFPSGISSEDEKGLEYMPSRNVMTQKNGVLYSYYEGKFKSINQLTAERKKSEGQMKNFIIKDAPLQDGFGYEFRSLINIPQTGIYRFYTYSDDGSQLLIDGRLVVDNDGSHNARRVDGKIGLEAGFHEIKVLYFEDYMGQVLEVGFSGKDIRETTIPDHLLFIPD